VGGGAVAGAGIVGVVAGVDCSAHVVTAFGWGCSSAVRICVVGMVELRWWVGVGVVGGGRVPVGIPGWVGGGSPVDAVRSIQEVAVLRRVVVVLHTVALRRGVVDSVGTVGRGGTVRWGGGTGAWLGVDHTPVVRIQLRLRVVHRICSKEVVGRVANCDGVYSVHWDHWDSN